MPMLENCHAYKDYRARQAAEQKVEPPSHGLFAYPVLMAADILAYQSDIVPVGRDQKQHVEVTRDLAEKWNDSPAQLPIPEASILPDTAAIPGLDGQKMSKSYGNTIGIFEDEKPLRKKIMGIVTDSTPVEAPKNPEGSPILPALPALRYAREVAAMEPNSRPAAMATAISRSGFSPRSGSTLPRCAPAGPSWKATPDMSTRC